MPTKEFDYTGSRQSWKIPAGVKIVDVVIEGGGSGTRGGGRVAGRMAVTPENTLYIFVGQRGQGNSGGAGGGVAFGGGGRGGPGAGPARPGGDGGGGASYIRGGAPDGVIRAVAGGAGGTSGDGGLGGRGGNAPEGDETNRGEMGFNSQTNTGTAGVGRATGGTQNQGGKGGTSALKSTLQGGDGADAKVGLAGRGGGPEGSNIYGGGGGGGGYYPGGGGQAGAHNLSRGGGGAGGSNYDGGLYNATSNRNGGTGHGRIVLTWDAPGGDTPPTAPNDLKINGQAIQDGLATKSMGEVTVTGDPNDPDKAENVRLYVRYSDNENFTNVQHEVGTYDPQTQRDKVVLKGLKKNTRYWLRIHSQQQKPVKVSVPYASTNFWTNRSPLAPVLTGPQDNTEVPDTLNLTFTWTHVDVDGPGQGGFNFTYRRAASPGVPASAWIDTGFQNTSASTYTLQGAAGGGPFKANQNWEWTVRTKDTQGLIGPYAEPRSVKVVGTAITPIVVSPINGEAQRVDQDVTYRWKFRDETSRSRQTRVDLRTRIIRTKSGLVPGEPTWQQTDNIATTDQVALLPTADPESGLLIEWQVRAAAGLVPGPWSLSGLYWTVQRPGLATIFEPVDSGLIENPLGEGNNRVYVYQRGGEIPLGEITNARLIRWNRVRDDISGCTVLIDEPTRETTALINSAHSWRHELVVMREDGRGATDRVWEGPLTRKSSSRSSIEVEAKDVWAYAYRRIMRQGYTDAYQVINGARVGEKTVLARATQILLNAFAYDDPNLIDYLTPMPNAGDASSTRSRPDFSRMVWEEIDDMAAVAGLDYTAAGRRMILNDTHRAIGKLPEFTDSDFSEPPVITEYGMTAANVFAVTDGSGLYGVAYPGGSLTEPADIGPEGWLEQLASAYGEDQTAAAGGPLTALQIQKKRDAFRAQARLNISGRWPVPVLVRVPDNARLNPSLQIPINNLIPGVWAPLRADNGQQSIAQWQKMDSLTVEQTKQDGEKVTVVMSPAPNEGQDPDADAAALEA